MLFLGTVGFFGGNVAPAGPCSLPFFGKVHLISSGAGHPRLNIDFFGQSNVQILLSPFAGDSYLQSQRGLFTYVKSTNREASERARWVPHDETIKRISENGAEPCFLRIRIPTRFAQRVLERLYNMRISIVDLMPTLDRAAYNLRIYKRIIYDPAQNGA